MTDWKAANLALRAARDAMDEQKRREAEREAARLDAEQDRFFRRRIVDRALMQAGLL